MRQRLADDVGVVLLAALAMLGLGWLMSVEAAKRPPFVVGETYVVVWDCLPAWMTPVGVNPETGEHVRGNPCYTERLTVRVVYEDGWLDVVDAEEARVRGTQHATVWRINAARAISITVERNPERRAV